jgi:tRNA(adenine34) deaminase
LKRHEIIENPAPLVLSHEYFMRQALREAQKAFDANEVPIGCIIVQNKRIIGKGYNQTEKLNDATAHAEMLAITAATNHLGSKYLEECTVYITIEPCTMCAGALFWARPELIVFGAIEPKVGFTRHQHAILHPKTKVLTGVLDHECLGLIKKFFVGARNK